MDDAGLKWVFCDFKSLLAVFVLEILLLVYRSVSLGFSPIFLLLEFYD